MRIKLTSLMVDDQDKALKFYTDVLGFRKKHEFPVGAYKWLTVVSPERWKNQSATPPMVAILPQTAIPHNSQG